MVDDDGAVEDNHRVAVDMVLTAEIAPA